MYEVTCDTEPPKLEDIYPTTRYTARKAPTKEDTCEKPVWMVAKEPVGGPLNGTPPMTTTALDKAREWFLAMDVLPVLRPGIKITGITE